MAESLVTLITF